MGHFFFIIQYDADPQSGSSQFEENIWIYRLKKIAIYNSDPQNLRGNSYQLLTTATISEPRIILVRLPPLICYCLSTKYGLFLIGSQIIK